MQPVAPLPHLGSEDHLEAEARQLLTRTMCAE
jgi:hypothetical protein